MTNETASPGHVRHEMTSGDDEANFSQLSIALMFQMLRRSWVFVVLCALVGMLIGLSIILMPRHYTAASKIQVRPGSSSQYKLDPAELLSAGDDSKLDTEVLVLQSDTLLLDVAKKLGLESNPDFIGRSKPFGDPSAAVAQEGLLDVLHKNVTVTRIPRTQIIQIACNSRSPLLSARVVNTLVAEYIERLFQSRFSSTQRVTKWLSGQLDDLKQQVEADQERLIQLQARLGVVGLEQNHDIVVSELEDLTKAADEARVQRIIAEARYRILSAGDINLLEGGQDILGKSPSNPQMALLANLRNQKATVEAHYAGLSAQFGPKYPEVKQVAAELATLNKEIDLEQQRVLNQAQEAYKASAANEQNTVATLEEKKSEAFQKQNDMVQYQILLHDYESSRSLYEGLMQRLRQAGIVAGLDSSEVDIVDMARVPGRPSESSRTVTVVLGLILGMSAGVTAAFVFSQFDQRLHDLSTIETRLGLPLLSISSRVAKDELTKDESAAFQDDMPSVFRDQSNSPFVESMWSLRASLLLSGAGRAPKTILISSCNPGEGKSTIACAQACTLALRNARVLLVDGDMRRPTVYRRFGLRSDRGLSSILAGQASVEEVLQSVPAYPGLFVLASGVLPPSAALLLSSEGLSKLFATLREQFDFIVIDTPPMLGLSDASALAQFADAIVIVLSYHRFHPSQMQRAAKVLLRVGRSITGIALNFADPGALGAYGYYGYASGAKKESGR